MTKPTVLPEFASGSASLVEPPATGGSNGNKDEGYVAGQVPLDGHLNWLFFHIYEWCAYLDGLTSETLTWTGRQTFNRSIIVNNSADTASSAITATNSASGNRTITVSSLNINQAILALSSTASFLIHALHSGAGDAIYGHNTGSGAALKGLSEGTGPGLEVESVNGNSVTSEASDQTLLLTNTGTGAAAQLTSASGHALRVTGGATAGNAAILDGTLELADTAGPSTLTYNKVRKLNTPKVFGSLVFNGAGTTATAASHLNLPFAGGSTAVDGTGVYLTISLNTLANDDFTVLMSPMATSGVMKLPYIPSGGKTTTSVKIYFRKLDGNNLTLQSDLANEVLDIAVMGEA